MTAPSRIGIALFLAVACVPVRAGEKAPTSTDVYASWGFYNNMGWAAFRLGDLDLARDRFTHAIEYVRPYQKDYPRLMSRSCHDLTRVLCVEGRFADAEAMAKWVVEAREHDPRTRDDVMFDSVYLLAVVYRELDRDPADVVPLLRKALALEERHLGGGDVRLGSTLKELADAEADSGMLEDADVHYRRAALIYKQHDVRGFNLVDALEARAAVLARLDRTTHADLLRREAADLRGDAQAQPRLADSIKNPLASFAESQETAVAQP